MEQESRVLLEEASPSTDIRAIVEDDGESIYLYLYGPLNSDACPAGLSVDTFSPVRTCWIGNKKEASSDPTVRMKEGKAPLVPTQFCVNKEPLELDPSQLELVWFEEGDAAALLYQKKVLGVIPTWGVVADGKHGYSANLAAPFLDFMPLDKMPKALFERIEKASKFWKSWLEEESEERYFRPYYLALQKAFGQVVSQAPLEGNFWPLKMAYIFEKGDDFIFATCGMSILCQPRVEAFVDDPKQFRRIELGLALSKTVVHEAGFDAVLNVLRDVSFTPWELFLWLHDGHTISYPLDFLPGKDGKKYNQLALSKERTGYTACAFTPYRDDPVTFLWLTLQHD